MAGPKDFEAKMERMLNAWHALAPEKSFGGMTLAQFEAVAAPAQTARRKIIELTEQLSKAIAERDASDRVFWVRAQHVVAGVLADPTEGPDSALYQAFGYTRKSDRKSGLTRRRNQAPES